MMKYRYMIKPLAQRKIRSFYYNVAKKYKHTYSKWLMYKNIDDAIDGMFQIENSLLRVSQDVNSSYKKAERITCHLSPFT